MKTWDEQCCQEWWDYVYHHLQAFHTLLTFRGKVCIKLEAWCHEPTRDAAELTALYLDLIAFCDYADYILGLYPKLADGMMSEQIEGLRMAARTIKPRVINYLSR